MQRFTDLAVWQRSHQLVLKLYKLTAAFPPDGRFGLISQLRVRQRQCRPTSPRRQSRAEYARFLNVAEASLAETEYLLMLSKDLGFVLPQAFGETSDEIAAIARMLHALRLKVKRPTRGI
jgi:hypothetical protein